VSQNLRGARKFSDMGNISESDHSPAKAQRRQVQRRICFLQNLCAFAPLREIFRDLVAALLRWGVRGEIPAKRDCGCGNFDRF
jgi:hypothetical protein